MNGEALCKGRFKVEAFDREGNLKWSEEFPNGNTTVGLTYLLNAGLHATTQSTAWYIGLIDNTSFTALSAADTMASHAGWIELQDYDEAARVAWAENLASGGAITNTTTSDFTINATVDIKGIFVVDVSTKGGTTGTLYATGAFGSLQSLVATNVLKITYTSTLTPA